MSACVDVRRLAVRSDLAEEAEGIRLVAAFLVLTGMRQRPLGECVPAAGRQMRLPQGETTETLTPGGYSSFAIVCSIACVSNGTASATRLARGCTLAPKAGAIMGNRGFAGLPRDEPWPVRARGGALGRSPWQEGKQTNSHEAYIRLAR